MIGTKYDPAVDLTGEVSLSVAVEGVSALGDADLAADDLDSSSPGGEGVSFDAAGPGPAAPPAAAVPPVSATLPPSSALPFPPKGISEKNTKKSRTCDLERDRLGENHDHDIFTTNCSTIIMIKTSDAEGLKVYSYG